MQIGETYRRTNINGTLHRSELYGGVARLNPLFSEDTRKHTWNLQKKNKKVPKGLWETRFSGLMNLNSKHHVWRKAGTAHHLQSTIPKVKCAGSSLMFFSDRDWGTRQSRRKAQCTKILRWKHIIQNLRPGRRFTFQQDNDPTSTLQEWLLDNCKCPSVAQPGIEPNQIFLEKPENVCLPPSNLTELERWREEWQIIARWWWWSKLVSLPRQCYSTLIYLFATLHSVYIGHDSCCRIHCRPHHWL